MLWIFSHMNGSQSFVTVYIVQTNNYHNLVIFTIILVLGNILYNFTISFTSQRSNLCFCHKVQFATFMFPLRSSHSGSFDTNQNLVIFTITLIMEYILHKFISFPSQKSSLCLSKKSNLLISCFLDV